MGRKDEDRLGNDPDRPGMVEPLAPSLEQMATMSPRAARRDTGRDQTREANDRAHTEDREEEDDERLEMFISTFLNNTLPEMPDIPGYHLCWLSTTNTKDTIHMRLRIGYQLVKPEEIRGWETVKLTSGDYAGYVGVNEMVLAKLPNRLYQRYMQAVSHDMPMDEASKMRYKVENANENARAVKSSVTDIDGNIAAMDRHAPVPDFNDPNWRPPAYYIEQMLRKGT